MPISDADPEQIRATLTYRAALWCARLEFLILFALCAVRVVVPVSGLAAALAFLAALLFMTAALILMRRLGLLSVRGLVAKEEINRQFQRDLLWLGRR